MLFGHKIRPSARWEKRPHEGTNQRKSRDSYGTNRKGHEAEGPNRKSRGGHALSHNLLHGKGAVHEEPAGKRDAEKRRRGKDRENKPQEKGASADRNEKSQRENEALKERPPPREKRTRHPSGAGSRTGSRSTRRHTWKSGRRREEVGEPTPLPSSLCTSTAP